MKQFLYINLALGAWAQLWCQSTATCTGMVRDPAGLAIPGAKVTLRNLATGFEVSSTTATSGEFAFRNLPFHTYELIVEKAGFMSLRQTVSLRSNVPVALEFTLPLASEQTVIRVFDREPGQLIEPQATGTQAEMNQRDIERLPGLNRGLETALVTFSGFAQNANGAIHPRGAHNQMTFVVDGMPISDQLTGAFANAVDPNIVQTVELYTGNIPAEYGSKVAAVANVTTRSGLGSGRSFAGSLLLGAAQFDTLQSVAQAVGERGKWGYSTSFHAWKSNRYLDQVSLENLHNGGNNERGFARLDGQLSSRDSIRFNLLAGRSSFQLANLPSQHANGMAQRQTLKDLSLMSGWVRSLDASATFDSTLSVRTATARLHPSPGDTPVTASQWRRLTTWTAWNRVNVVRARHQWKAGLDGQYFPVEEQFAFGVTDSRFNHPDSPHYIPTLEAHDLTRGGRLFRFHKRAAGGLYTAFLQDQARWGPFHFSLGLRQDFYRFLVRGNQLQPRLGVSYHLSKTNTVVRASYNRTYQTPPNENLLLSNSEESAVLVAPDVRETVGGAVVPIRPERQNLYELGLQQALGRLASLNLAFYHKNARDQQDNNNFFNTPVIFPMALARLRVNGAEARLVLPDWKGLTASVSATHARALSTPPFTGGLFLGNTAVEILNAGPFVIDHDQKLGLHSVIHWRGPRGFFLTNSTRYDSGLVTNPSDEDEVAADPDYADLLPYVNLRSNPPRTRPRTITDLLVGMERVAEGRKKWELSVQFTNLTNRTALYNFQSLFVGTRLVQPRTAAIRLRWHF
ncbi:MAG: TonB-dependent receptor [Bryobacteraceae bacterium]|nr:TonB-dependent receptor [Bryobacteraceae bacterium]MDW8380166.1 TonB-dependent receptor [Bryobacterales bacterium]